MWRKRLIELLKSEIEEVISSVDEIKELGPLLKEPLSKTRRGLAPGIELDRPWSLLPLIISESVGGEPTRTLPLAAAMQFFLSAADVFDDIEDADSPDSLLTKYGLATATSIATTLLILGERSLSRLSITDVGANIIIRSIESVNSFYAIACAGQYLDLNKANQLSQSEEMYLKIIEMKTASQVQCACYTGALLAGASQQTVDKFSLFGLNLGMASQIGNDIQGIIKGTDIIRSKITLPVIYALGLPDSTIRNELKQAYQKQNPPVHDSEQVKKLLFHTGAIHYTTLKMDLYKLKALDVLSDIKEDGANVDRLKLLLM
jgi:geranylgeranyl pyrophosphate synthase